MAARATSTIKPPEPGNPPTEAEEIPLCNKCGNLRDTTGRPHWCKECRAAYQANYRAKQDQTAYVQGANAMRWAIAQMWAKWPNSVFNGAEISTMCHQCAMPAMPVKPPVD